MCMSPYTQIHSPSPRQLGIAQPHLWIMHAAAFGDHPRFPNLAKFACNILPLLASGCKVEREFSVLGKITMWQWSNLSIYDVWKKFVWDLAATDRKSKI